MSIRSSMFTVLLLLYLALCPGLISCDTLSDIQSDPSSSLLSMLKKFVGARNDKTQPEGKREARDFIRSTFKKNGLQVWTERAKIGNSTYAENIVGMLRSRKTGTADDKIVIVGAHYDTTENTPGVNDNGSGVTALLQVAKNIGKARCQVNNTVLFVAFDFEELTDSCILKPKWPIACGSNRFVKNLTTYLSRTGGTVSGAIILETMLNHNSSAGSQTLPPGFQFVLPDAYAELKNYSMRGNFLAVVGRKESDRRLLSLIEKHYPEDSGYRAQLLSIPISGRPSLSPQHDNYEDLYRSDHYEFWEAKASYSALMLTDTANLRGYMQHCYHMECDDLSHVEEDDLEFLRRSINSVIKAVLDLSEAGSCRSGGTNFGGATLSFSFFVMLSTMVGTYVL